jgi:flagellar hook-length control protein FliK
MKGATARLAEQTKITEEAATLSREALLAHLSQHFSRIKTDSKADTELLRSMYVNAKLSGLMPSRGT